MFAEYNEMQFKIMLYHKRFKIFLDFISFKIIDLVNKKMENVYFF